MTNPSRLDLLVFCTWISCQHISDSLCPNLNTAPSLSPSDVPLSYKIISFLELALGTPSPEAVLGKVLNLIFKEGIKCFCATTITLVQTCLISCLEYVRGSSLDSLPCGCNQLNFPRVITISSQPELNVIIINHQGA